MCNCTGAVGENVLFFGCRSANIDFIYGDELQQAQKDGLLNLFLAFSRDQQDKVYVQHKMRDYADGIWAALNDKNGYFYVCGYVLLSLLLSSVAPHCRTCVF